MSDELYNQIINNEYSDVGHERLNINGYEYYVQVPEGGINEDTVFYVAGRGSFGITDTISTFDEAKGKNVVVIAPVNETQENFNYSIDVAKGLKEKSGISDLNMSFGGHSNSGNLTMQTASEYCKETGKSTTIVLSDPYGTGTYNEHYLGNNFDYNTLNGSLIIDLTPSKEAGVYADTLKRAAAGGATVLLVGYDGDHGESDDISAAIGLYNPGSALLPTSVNVSKVGTKSLKYYTYDQYGNLKEISPKEAQEILNDASGQKVFIDGEPVEEKRDDIEKLYEDYKGSLNEFSKHVNTDGTSLGSNLGYVYNTMERLADTTTKTNDFLSYRKDGETQGIAGRINLANNFYFNTVGMINKSTQGEADAITKLAEAIYRMDTTTANIASSSLNEGYIDGVVNSDPEAQRAFASLDFYIKKVENNMFNYVSNGGSCKSCQLFTPLNTNQEIGKTSKSQLYAAIKDIGTSYQYDIASAQNRKQNIDQFVSRIGEGNVLSGAIFDKVKKNLTALSDLTGLEIKTCEFMEKTMKVAVEMVLDAMEDEEMDAERLEPAKKELDEAKKQLERAKATIRSLQASLIHMQNNKKRKDKDGNEVGSYTDADISRVQASIREWEVAVDKYEHDIKELEEEIRKIEKYIEAVKKAEQLIIEANEYVNNKLLSAATAYNNSTETNFNFSSVNLDFNEFFKSTNISLSDNKTCNYYINKFDSDFQILMNYNQPVESDPTPTAPGKTIGGTTGGGNPGYTGPSNPSTNPIQNPEPNPNPEPEPEPTPEPEPIPEPEPTPDPGKEDPEKQTPGDGDTDNPKPGDENGDGKHDEVLPPDGGYHEEYGELPPEDDKLGESTPTPIDTKPGDGNPTNTGTPSNGGNNSGNKSSGGKSSGGNGGKSSKPVGDVGQKPGVEKKPTDPIEPTNPIDPIEPTNPIDPIEPTNPVEPIDPTDPTPGVEPTPPTIEPVPPIIDDPVTPEPKRPAIDIPYPAQEIYKPSDPSDKNSGNNTLKALALASAIGAVAGAGAYAVHKHKENKELEDGYKYEYEYDGNGEEKDYNEVESNYGEINGYNGGNE